MPAGIETLGLPWQVRATLGATPEGYTRDLWRAVGAYFAGAFSKRFDMAEREGLSSMGLSDARNPINKGTFGDR